MFKRPNDFLFRIDGFSRRESRRSPRYRWDNAKWPDRNYVIFQHTLDGQGIYESKEIRHTLGPGTAFLAIIPESSSYYYPAGATETWDFRWLNFNGAFSHVFWRAFRDEFGSVLPLDLGSMAEHKLRELMTFLDQGSPSDVLTVSELTYSFALAWQSQLRQQTAKPLDPLQAAEAFCKLHYRLPIKVKEIACHVGLSREHLTRTFQERFGLSPAAYLRNLRLNAARNLLASTGHPLSEVASLAGFEDARQLKKWLKRSDNSARGKSPADADD